MTEKITSKDLAEISQLYQVGCPDILEIKVDGCPELEGQTLVEPDGRIDLGNYGALRVEGKTLPQITQLMAEECRIPAEKIHIEMGDYRSQFVILFGQVIGWQRVVPYRGQETVLTMLRRVGGITRGAAPEEVYVVRTNMDNGKRPQAYRVDLNAIVMKGDDSTNIRLEPFDQIYVGETKLSRLERCVPPWIRPLYQAFWDTRPAQTELKENRAAHFRRISAVQPRTSPPPTPSPALKKPAQLPASLP